MEEKLFEVVQMLAEVANKSADVAVESTKVNKRLTRAIVTGIIAVCAMVTICFGILYTSESNVSVQQQQEMSTETKIMKQQQQH